MSDTVIKAEGLGKKYLIGHQSEREGYTALRDVLARSLRNTLHKTRQVFKGQQLLEGDSVEEFWALKDIDFEIKRGDRVGIIGRNGAGKSTLLKVLSRITEPSVGRVEIKGRVASLLEVGTGFHPELTGRENIYLNGAILGMSRSDIKRKFDEIVDFASVDKFLDTLVKRYSSGMYVRLAFSVAAHLEPEILIVDEVLAVGDAEFQKKCLGKMEDVSKGEGRTVLFVSHNMEVIRKLCPISLLLYNGNLMQFGETAKAINRYLSTEEKLTNTILNKKLNEFIEIQEFSFTPNEVLTFSELNYTLEFSLNNNCSLMAIAILIYSEYQERIAIIDLRGHIPPINKNKIQIKGKIVDVPFIEGIYSVGLYINSNYLSENYYNLINFKVKNKEDLITIPYPTEVRGYIELNHSATIKPTN
ncbi:MAG: ABC transporter ATP-binding protein [Saprospiraceae bacterium]